MADAAELIRELDALERVRTEISAIATRTDGERRGALIELRRRLSAQVARIGELADRHFDAGDPETARQYRTLYSRVRSRTALHQAEWPAVRIDANAAAYRASVQGVHEAHGEFLAWMRETLRARPTGG